MKKPKIPELNPWTTDAAQSPELILSSGSHEEPKEGRCSLCEKIRFVSGGQQGKHLFSLTKQFESHCRRFHPKPMDA